MELIYSKIEPNRLLHIVHRVDEFYKMKDGFRRDVIGETEFLQLGAMILHKDKTFKAHKHIHKDGEDRVMTQESWVVIKGSVQCKFYDVDDTLLKTPILYTGDCSVTLDGGHTYLSLEDDTLVYEYKTGPYKGQKNDKIFLDEINNGDL